jgi:hypothetical protein
MQATLPLASSRMPGSRSCRTGRGIDERSGPWAICQRARLAQACGWLQVVLRRLMRRDVLELRAFYGPRLGRAAQTMMAARWRGLGRRARPRRARPRLRHPVPGRLRPRQGAPVVAAMPAQQGVEVWAGRRRPQPGLPGRRDALPLPNALFDRVLAVHALEESDAPAPCCPKPAGSGPHGRLIVAWPRAAASWCHAEARPSATAAPTPAASWRRCCARRGWSPRAGRGRSMCRRSGPWPPGRRGLRTGRRPPVAGAWPG